MYTREKPESGHGRCFGTIAKRYATCPRFSGCVPCYVYDFVVLFRAMSTISWFCFVLCPKCR